MNVDLYNVVNPRSSYRGGGSPWHRLMLGSIAVVTTLRPPLDSARVAPMLRATSTNGAEGHFHNRKMKRPNL